MADDSDIPPLEDMTDMLQKAELIREQQKASQDKNTNQGKIEVEDLKKRAKVTKKNVGTSKTMAQTEQNAGALQDKSDPKYKAENVAMKNNITSQGIFGGMKKGFLFGGPSKKPSKVTDKMSSKPKTSVNEDLPFISPSGKTESGLTLDEVQEAMSEAKGLLDDQEWITDDFLSKIENNETLLKRFSDPQFMLALQEFQTNPQSAMAKYKGNTEVEKFLMEFCGVLGDHFTKFGESETKQPSNKTVQQSTPTVLNQSASHKTENKQCPKIVEIDDSLVVPENHSSADGALETSNTKGKNDTSIQIHDPQKKAEINEIQQSQTTPMEDDDVKKVLNDPKVMETLMDPEIMTLIRTLREDPGKAQKLIDKADRDLKKKIQLLVSKGLLQFQMS